MKFENTEVWGFKHALHGMRNPKNSWGKSDSGYSCKFEESICQTHCTADTMCGGANVDKFIIGPNDMKLAQTLIRAGSEHRKFMRQIFVSVDITAPLYWWKEFDTYKVGTVANSTSTMHKITSSPITRECFETDDYCGDLLVFDKEPYDYDKSVDDVTDDFINFLETLRKRYLETKDKRYWKELIRWLPESWLQTRTITMSYENILSMCRQRKTHKLSEWQNSFIAWALSLPYAQELVFIDEMENNND